MTRVCLVGDPEVNVQYELLSRETAREALSTYDLEEPFANAVGVETVSLGAAVALLNDLDWYLARFVADALVLEPSVSDREWLSRDLAAAVRDDEVSPDESGRFLKVYGLVPAGDDADDAGTGAGTSAATDDEPGAGTAVGTDGDTAEEGAPGAGRGTETASPDDGTAGPSDRPLRPVEPMYVTRTGPDLPTYDLRDVTDTLVVRVTEEEFGA